MLPPTRAAALAEALAAVEEAREAEEVAAAEAEAAAKAAAAQSHELAADPARLAFTRQKRAEAESRAGEVGQPLPLFSFFFPLIVLGRAGQSMEQNT